MRHARVRNWRFAAPATWPDAPSFRAGAAILAYLVLDYVSDIDPATRFGFTLWNPTAGLAVFLGFITGWRAIPVVLAGAAIAAIAVRGLSIADPAVWFSAAMVATGYTALGMFLRWRATTRDPFAHPLDALSFLLVGIVGAGVVAALLVLGLAAGGLLDVAAAFGLTLRLWIGDATGIAVLLPLLLRFRAVAPASLTTYRRFAPEAIGAAMLACALAGLTSLGPEASVGIAYLTLLPVVWIAVRFGLDATIVTVTCVQVVIAAVAVLDQRGQSFAEFQVMTIVIALTGPILGSAVDYAKRSAEELAKLRVDGERLARLTSVGALGSIIAHELSQPLSAVRTASHVLARSLKQSDAAPEIRRAAATIEAQIEAASARVRSLRTAFQNTGPEATDIDLADTARAAARVAAAERTGPAARIRIDTSPQPIAHADRQHVAHILLNVFRNAFTATAAKGENATIRVSFVAEDRISTVRIEDDGPGVPSELDDTLFEPMASGRPDGVGLGLFICKTLAGLNSGDLVHDRPASGRGAAFVLTLPRGKT